MSKHIEFYERAMEAGNMSCDGLCGAVELGWISKDTFDLFRPTDEDYAQLRKEKQMVPYANEGYWGSGVMLGAPGRVSGFTPLRQTIVLFMAAINNEL